MLAILDKDAQTAADVEPIHKPVEMPNAIDAGRIDRVAEPVAEVQASTIDAGIVSSRNVISEDATVDPREEILDVPQKAAAPVVQEAAKESPVVEGPKKRKLIRRK